MFAGLNFGQLYAMYVRNVYKLMEIKTKICLSMSFYVQIYQNQEVMIFPPRSLVFETPSLSSSKDSLRTN